MGKLKITQRIYNKITRTLKFYPRTRKARKLGITFVKPNFIYLDVFDSSSIIVDVGCADDADFSTHMIDKYGLQSFGVDPTLKHRNSLLAFEKRAQGRFKHLSLAVVSVDGSITFNESLNNVSGSVRCDHINVIKDRCRSYEVEAVTLKSLLRKIGHTSVDFIKLDIEGAEYELLSRVTESDLSPFKQIFVEFHHHTVGDYSPRDTRSIVQSICEKGYCSFTLDDLNYLFFQKGLVFDFALLTASFMRVFKRQRKQIVKSLT